jgi:type II secretory ATPase GspE/PulE/Tfp pilus assembly ATPase PilB-like protein
MVTFNDEEQNKRLQEVRAIQEEESTKKQADDTGLPYVNLVGMGINMDGLKLVDEADARAALAVVFAMVGKNISVAVKSPYNEKTLEILNRLEEKGYTTKIFLCSMASINKALDRYADISGANFAHQGLLDISSSALENLAKSVHSNTEITAKINELLQAKEPHLVSKLMEVIFGTAIGTKSSDVHIEAAEDHGRLRYRQDGVLQDIIDFPLEIYKQLNSRIKLLSEMKISNSAIAQDGRFTINYKEIEIEIRTSLIPGPYGESIVMRILNPEGLTVDMEKLGFDKNLFEILGHEIRKPNGMILNTGPTGSGKTTTLYSILKTIYSPEIKLLTIEDPIEYHLDGITQTQIDHEKGYGFAEGLRAALRQDPDVVMVGEIRDKETATTAVNASLTGHLVLSTLHTNNAAGAIPRMIELGVSPRILPDALTLCMAQRLVRKLCTSCRRKATITETQEKLLRDILTDAQKNKKPLHLYNITPESGLELYTAGPGCPRCNNTGFKGQTGLFEAIRIDDAVIDAINKNPSERDIRRAAASQGIFTMAEDAVIKIITGVTSIEEVETVVDLSDAILIQAGDEKSNHEEVVNQEKDTQKTNNQEKSDKEPISIETDKKVEPSAELKSLINYLKLLEKSQHENPTDDASESITEVEKLILGIIRKYDTSEIFDTRRGSDYVVYEIDMLMERLKKLREAQKKNPTHGIAHHIEDLRNTIEKLSPKE